jgi:hypothetical protein
MRTTDGSDKAAAGAMEDGPGVSDTGGLAVGTYRTAEPGVAGRGEPENSAP